MTLEEEVARVACALTGNDPDGDGWVPGTRAWQDEDYIAFARAAIAIIQPRAEAEGAAKVVAWLREQDGYGEWQDAANAFEAGEHRKDEASGTITPARTPPAVAPPPAPSSTGPAPSQS